jgi:hypothetical protein
VKDSGQLTFTTMGGETVIVPVRGKHYVQQRGYAAPPGTGPVGETCGKCKHIVVWAKFRKCGLTRAKWTSGPKTDILSRSPACSAFAPASSGPVENTEPGA